MSHEVEPNVISKLDYNLAKNVRLIRKSLGMTQEEMSDALGFKFGTRLSEIERCRGSCTLRWLERLASGLGVDPLALVQERRFPLQVTLKKAPPPKKK